MNATLNLSRARVSISFRYNCNSAPISFAWQWGGVQASLNRAHITGDGRESVDFKINQKFIRIHFFARFHFVLSVLARSLFSHSLFCLLSLNLDERLKAF